MLQLYISNQKQTIYGLALFLNTTGIVCTELLCKVKVHKLGQSDGARSTSTTLTMYVHVSLPLVGLLYT